MESSNNLVHLIAKLETLVSRFESALGGAPVPMPADGPSAPAQKAVEAPKAAAAVKKENPIIAAFDKEVLSKVKAMEDAANVLGGVIPTITQKFINCLLSQKDVINTILACKRPDDKLLLLKHIQTAANDVRALKNKEPKFSLHVQTLADGFGIFSWSAQPILEDEWKDEALNAINFYGYKVLQLKQDPDTAWQKAYTSIASTFLNFVFDNKDDIHEWKG